jgi:hypothetical protein
MLRGCTHPCVFFLANGWETTTAHPVTLFNPFKLKKP